MCGGIAFWVTAGLAPEAIQRIEKEHVPRLRHRGPAASAVKRALGGKYILGHHSSRHGPDGMQPLTFSEPQIAALLCTGSIFNYRRICPATSKSDAETVHEVLKGCKFADVEDVARRVSRLDGEYAFVYLTVEGFVAARDPVGVRPLFYGTDATGRVAAIASEAKALHGAPGIASIRTFPPGHVFVQLQGQQGQSQQQKREGWRQFFEAADAEGFAAETVRDALTRAVAKRLDHSFSNASNAKIGILCSGGLDSGILTSLAARITPDKSRLKIFTVQYDVGRSEDAFYAAALRDLHGFDLTIVKFGAADVIAVIREVIRICETADPATVRAAVPMYLLARHIAQNAPDVRVVLSGEGADEVFGAHAYFRAAPSADAVNAEAARLVKDLHAYDLLRVDRCFAAFGIEVRLPYLDRDFVGGVAAMSGTLKQFREGDAEKALLRRAFSSYDDLVRTRILERVKEPLADGCGYEYMPALLRRICPKGVTVEDRERDERILYSRIFEANYGPRHAALVPPRRLPTWAGGGDVEGGADDNAKKGKTKFVGLGGGDDDQYGGSGSEPPKDSIAHMYTEMLREGKGQDMHMRQKLDYDKLVDEVFTDIKPEALPNDDDRFLMTTTTFGSNYRIVPRGGGRRW